MLEGKISFIQLCSLLLVLLPVGGSTSFTPRGATQAASTWMLWNFLSVHQIHTSVFCSSSDIGVGCLPEVCLPLSLSKSPVPETSGKRDCYCCTNSPLRAAVVSLHPSLPLGSGSKGTPVELPAIAAVLAECPIRAEQLFCHWSCILAPVGEPLPRATGACGVGL